jgi:hypothetical protein
MEKIQLGEHITLYKVNYIPINSKESIINSVTNLISLQPENDLSDAYTYLKNRFDEIDEIEKKGIEICLEIEGSLLGMNYQYDTWVNRVRAKDPVQRFGAMVMGHPYHNHTDINKTMLRYTPKYTYIYYIQMPNNLTKDEGELVLKDIDGNVYSILPKENEFLIHSSNIDHYPKEASSSSVDRLVIAGNVGFE